MGCAADRVDAARFQHGELRAQELEQQRQDALRGLLGHLRDRLCRVLVLRDRRRRRRRIWSAVAARARAAAHDSQPPLAQRWPSRFSNSPFTISQSDPSQESGGGWRLRGKHHRRVAIRADAPAKAAGAGQRARRTGTEASVAVLREVLPSQDINPIRPPLMGPAASESSICGLSRTHLARRLLSEFCHVLQVPSLGAGAAGPVGSRCPCRAALSRARGTGIITGSRGLSLRDVAAPAATLLLFVQRERERGRCSDTRCRARGVVRPGSG